MILECSHFGRQQVTADRIEAGILLCLIVDLLERKPQSNKSSTTLYKIRNIYVRIHDTE